MKEFYSIIDHTADMGMLVYADSIVGLFMNGAQALMEILLGKGYRKEGNSIIKPITIEGLDHGDLMVRWLGELLYIFDAERLIYIDSRELSVDGTFLKAQALFIPFDETRHEIDTYIKAITYHQAEVRCKNGLWEATIIFDI